MSLTNAKPFTQAGMSMQSHPLGLPHSEQNFPLFTVPQLHVHGPAGLGAPHSEQNFPVFTWPHPHVHAPPAAFAPIAALAPIPALPGAAFIPAGAFIPIAAFGPAPAAPIAYPPWPRPPCACPICICCRFDADAAPIKPPPIFIPAPMPINPAIAPPELSLIHI